MPKLEHRRHHVLLSSAILTLSVASLVAVNVVIERDNRRLRKERADQDSEAASLRVFGKIRAVLSSPGPPESKSIAFQELYARELLLMLQVNDVSGPPLFQHAGVGLSQEIVEKIAAADEIHRTTDPDRPLQDRMAVEPPGKAALDVTLVRGASYSAEGLPLYRIFFLLHRVAPPGMDSVQQTVVLCQTVFVVCAMALFWYLIRKLTRPYEILIREMKKNSPEARSSAWPIENEVAYLVGSFKDIIRRLKENEQRLEEMGSQARKRAASSEKYTRDILAGLRQGVICFDHSGRFLDCNPAMEDLLARKRVSMVNMAYPDLFTGSETLSEAVARFFSGRDPAVQTDIPLVSSAGDEVRVDLSVSPLTDPAGAFYGTICVVEDVSEKSQLRGRLQVQENLASLGEMAAGIAHELKNSLAAISGYAQMILGNARQGAEQKRAASLVKEVEDMARVIASFLEYARPTHAERLPVQLDLVLDDLVRDFSHRYPHVRFETDAEPLVISGEEYLLKKAFSNLLLNAVQAFEKANPAKAGIVKVKMEKMQSDRTIVFVDDNGPGMDERTQAGIFTPFFTTKAGGAGMGLPVVRKIVAAHDGDVRVVSEPGSGTRVEVAFPADRLVRD